MRLTTNEDLLDYLMTSDFNENMSPEELKELLVKFRQFYRIILSKDRNMEMEIKRFEFENEQIKNRYEVINQELKELNQHLLNIYHSMTKRRLSFLERLLGKIKPKKNEII